MLEGLSVPDAKEPDKAVSADYLMEATTTIFDVVDDQAETFDKPITIKKEKSADILNELDAILFKETGKKPAGMKPDDGENEKKEIKYKKISLFED